MGNNYTRFWGSEVLGFFETRMIAMARRTRIAWAMAALCGLMSSAACSKGTAPPEGTPVESAGEAVVVQLLKDPAPLADFTVTDLNGRSISSADLRGKVVLVNFWATWCPPCRAEIPDLIKLQDKYRDKLVVLGISEDEVSPDEVKAFVAEQKMNYPVAMTTPALAKIFRGVSALPTTFVIGRDGKLEQRHTGMLNAESDRARGAGVDRSEPERTDRAGRRSCSSPSRKRRAGDVDSRRRPGQAHAGEENRSDQGAQRRRLHLRVRPHARRVPHQRSDLQCQPAARPEDGREDRERTLNEIDHGRDAEHADCDSTSAELTELMSKARRGAAARRCRTRNHSDERRLHIYNFVRPGDCACRNWPARQANRVEHIFVSLASS